MTALLSEILYEHAFSTVRVPYTNDGNIHGIIEGANFADNLVVFIVFLFQYLNGKTDITSGSNN